jgi:hypothetical protein
MRPPGSASRFGLRAPSRRGLLAAAAVLVVGAVVALRLPARLVLESRVLNSSAVKSLPINALGIGVDDIAELSGRALVLARFVGDDARPQWQHNFDSPPQFSLVADVDGDGLDEMCLGTRDSAGAWARDLSKHARPTRFGPLLDPAAAPTAETGPWLLPWAVLADSGEARGLVCGTVNMYGPPRGIALYDVATAERRWSFAMGAWPGDVVVADLLGDGHAGLVVAGNSPANGMVVNGTDDSHACVVALDASGRRLWQVPLAGDFAKVQLLALPVERGRAARLVAAPSSPRTCPSSSRIFWISTAAISAVSRVSRSSASMRDLACSSSSAWASNASESSTRIWSSSVRSASHADCASRKDWFASSCA